MDWKTTRNISIGIFVITAFILVFGYFIHGVNISSTGILNSGLTWLHIVAIIQIYLAVMLWKEYIGKGGWYTQRSALIFLAAFSAFVLFGLGSGFGIHIFSSKIFLGVTWTILFGVGQLLFLLWIINRNI